MGLPWFRLYAEFYGDPKIGLLTFAQQRHYVMLLCMKCNGILDTKCPSQALKDQMIGNSLQIDEREAQDVKAALQNLGLIDAHWQPTAWKTRQFDSDSSAVRSKRWRAKVNGQPSHERLGDGSETAERRYRAEQNRTEHKEALKSADLRSPEEIADSEAARLLAMESLRSISKKLRNEVPK